MIEPNQDKLNEIARRYFRCGAQEAGQRCVPRADDFDPDDPQAHHHICKARGRADAKCVAAVYLEELQKPPAPKQARRRRPKPEADPLIREATRVLALARKTAR